MSLKQQIKKIRFHFSRDKKVLDGYLKAIRDLEQLSDTEWEVFKETAKRRKEIYTPTKEIS